MTLDFTIDEILDVLKLKGYKVIKEEADPYFRRFKYRKKQVTYLVEKDGESFNPIEVFKSLVIKKLSE